MHIVKSRQNISIELCVKNTNCTWITCPLLNLKSTTFVYTTWNGVDNALRRRLIPPPRPGSPSIRALLLLLRLLLLRLLRLLLQAKVSHSWSRPNVLIVATHVIWSLGASTWRSSPWSPSSKTVRFVCSHSRRARPAPTWASWYLWKRGIRIAYKTPKQKQEKNIIMPNRPALQPPWGHAGYNPLAHVLEAPSILWPWPCI